MREVLLGTSSGILVSGKVDTARNGGFRAEGAGNNTCWVAVWGFFLFMKSLEARITYVWVGSFTLTVTVTTMGYRSYKNPLIRPL